MSALPVEQRANADPEERDRQRFAAIVREIEQKFGYTVAAIPPPRENPYANMTPEQALKIAIDAGIVTKSGRLGKIYR
jgi:hypothetical protein